MKLTNRICLCLLSGGVTLALAGATSVATAQEEQPRKGPWEITLGAGAANMPEYPGSDEYEVRGLPVVSVRYKRFFLGSVPGSGSPGGLGAYLYEGESFRIAAAASVDAIKPREEADDVSLRGLGDIDSAVRAGLFSSYRIASWLSLRASAMRDVSDKGQGTTASIDAELSYRPTPRLTIAGGPGLVWADDEYMQTFFGIDDEQSARSGLAPHTAEAGVNLVRVSLGATYQFSGHWFAGARVTAAQLQDDVAESPIVKDKNQNLFAVFGGYRF